MPGYGYGSPAAPQKPALVSPVDPMSSLWPQLGDAATQAPLSQTTTRDHYHPVQTSFEGDPNLGGQILSHGATALGQGGPSDWEYFDTGTHVVSPVTRHSTPAELSPQASMQVTFPLHTVDETHPQAPSEINTPKSPGRAASQHDSISSHVSELTLERTGTIDSVIHAWSAPLQPRKSSSRNVSISESSPQLHATSNSGHAANLAYLHGLRTETPTPQSVMTPLGDPYSDLDPLSRSSLLRYVAVLRKESLMESDTEKWKIFDSFMQKERRLRAVLYDIDLTSDPTRESAVHESPRKPDSLASAEPINEGTRSRGEAPYEFDVGLSMLDAYQQKGMPKSVAKPLEPASPEAEERPQSQKGFDSHQNDGTQAFSPGGRPIIQKPINVKTRFEKEPPLAVEPAAKASQNLAVPSPSDNAPQLAGDDYTSNIPESPALAAPIVLTIEEAERSPRLKMASTSGPLAMPVKFEPPRPVYTPFRYVEGPANLSVQDYLSKRNTYDSSRLMAHEAEELASPTTTKKIQEETFLGLIRSHSTAIRPKPKTLDVPEAIRPGTSPPPAHMRPDPIGDAVEALRASVPSTLPEKSQTDAATKLRQRMDIMVDDFSFIRQTVIPWDRDNREVRKKLDEERHKRQEESETRLDELSNDNEIAYADLKSMEADVKLEEAERRYQEDREELESFTRGVYDVVTTQLQQQIDDLRKEYVSAIGLLNQESDPASRMLTGDPGRSSTADFMDIILQLFEKLNIRHHKLGEARYERERRSKRLELTVLYTNGDTDAVKKLNTRFSVAEKAQVLREARERDQRASELTDLFEGVAVKSLGDNQAFLDEICAKIRRVNDVLPVDGDWQQNATDLVYGENGPRQVLAFAQSVIDFVLADSRALLSTSNAADKILNDADYAVAVAEATMANADEITYSKLKADKEKEDNKLVDEMSMRMESVTKAPSEALHLIQEIIDRIGNDREHPDRLKAALEAAKVRNAGKVMGSELAPSLAIDPGNNDNPRPYAS